jgi:hypothetical protein
MKNKKEYKHEYSGIKISDELSDEEKDYIKAMYGWKESVQMPMLTEKIILLSKRIQRLNFWTSVFSIILILLTIILVWLSLK